ncbi:hypothetical protein TNCV_4686591 [Trichonephila clavipes]|nr:hypothetical protein TNCV_4686591 [Trichonephila clavipes]
MPSGHGRELKAGVVLGMSPCATEYPSCRAAILNPRGAVQHWSMDQMVPGHPRKIKLFTFYLLYSSRALLLNHKKLTGKEWTRDLLVNKSDKSSTCEQEMLKTAHDGGFRSTFQTR